MYFLNASFSDEQSLHVSVNSTNKYLASASNDGNIRIRSISQMRDLIPLDEPEEPDPDDNPTSVINIDSNEKITKPTRQISMCPPVDKSKLELAESPVNIVGVRSRSKVTSLRYANLKCHANLLAAVYKNGEVYIIRDPQNSAKRAIKQIFKQVNGLILDFSWSADDQLLAFSTVNDEVIIYDVIYERVISVLHLHEIPSADNNPAAANVPVKGIAFDNTCGKYLLTLGDDKMVNIIEYKLLPDAEEGRKFDYTFSQRFSDLIHSAKLNKATINKVSWSKDDRAVSVPNTSKSRSTLVSFLKNPTPNQGTEWKHWFKIVGHGFKGIMTLFSPVSYKSSDPANPYSYVLCTASNDSSIAIWRTPETEPLYVMNEVAPQSLQDICWSQDGRMLFITTSSGNLFIGVFREDELGEPSPDTDRDISDIEELTLRNEDDVKETFQQWFKDNKDKKPNLKLAPKIEKSSTPTANSNGHAKEEESRSNSTDSKSRKRAAPVSEKANGNKKRQTSSGSSQSQSQSQRAQSPAGSAKSAAKKPKGPVPAYDVPSTSVPRDLAHKVTKVSKHKEDETRKKREMEPSEFLGSVVINPQVSFSNIRVAVPRVRLQLKYSTPEDDTVVLQVKNGNGHESSPSRISLKKVTGSTDNKSDPATAADTTDKELFVDFIPHRVHIITGSSSYWALSTTNGQVVTYTNAGRRVLPTIILGSPLSFLEMKDQYLLAVTSIGEVYAWDLAERKSLFRPTSLYPLLQPIYRSFDQNASIDKNGVAIVNGELLMRSENLTMCSISSTGLPIVTLSNGNGYLYNGEMGTWSLVSDSWWAFGSQYWDSTKSLASNTEDSTLLGYLETHTNEEIVRRGKAKIFSKISKTMLMREGYENLETVISLNHLENKINLYLFLNDFTNFKSYLTIYAKRLSELNLKDRLTEIFQDLFMDLTGQLCGTPKKKLLEDLILSCSKQREVQRILVEYSESIGLLDNSLLDS